MKTIKEELCIVSACLAGFDTRHDGTNCADEKVAALIREGKAIPVCPEGLGGLPTPRPPIIIEGGDGGAIIEGTGRAVDERGFNRTHALIKGAEEALRIAGLLGIKLAILKDGSPSCGVTYVHTKGGRANGRGVTAELLVRNGLEVRTSDSL